MAKCTICKECYLTENTETITTDMPEKTLDALKRFAAHGFDKYGVVEDLITITRSEE